MAYANPYFSRLPGNYLFAEIHQRVEAHKTSHPDRQVISLGIGDVTQPLAPVVIEALHGAVDEMASADSFRGYGPEQGYAFLREAIARHDFAARGVTISPDEVFVSDGGKSDSGLFQALFSEDAKVALAEPAYPVYADTNAMCGRAGNWDGRRWDHLIMLPCTKETHFLPQFPDRHADIIYLCCPNNPTGATMDRPTLKKWVDFAKREGSVILFDAAYEAFITEQDVPHSIFEIEGAKDVAVEFRSFSKTAGFTGLRCAYTVVPKQLSLNVVEEHVGTFFQAEELFASQAGILQTLDATGSMLATSVNASTKKTCSVKLHDMWLRHQCTRFNGCPYIVQRAAEAVYSPAGQQQTRATLDIYRSNARRIRTVLGECGFDVFGGINAPYLWVATPGGMPSWNFFSSLLEQTSVVCTPGVGFGPSGEGYVRLTAFGVPEQTEEALRRISQVKRW